MYIKLTSSDIDNICSQIRKAKSQGDGAVGKVSRARNVDSDISSRLNISSDFQYLANNVHIEIVRLEILLKALQIAEADFEDADSAIRSKSKTTAAYIRKAQREVWWNTLHEELTGSIEALKEKLANLYDVFGVGGVVALSAITGGLSYLVLGGLYSDEIIESYKNKGAVYQAFQYGKCAYKIGKGVVKIVGAVAAVTTIAGIPVALCGAVSAGNDIINGITDLKYVSEGNYEKVGETNFLQDLLVENGGEIGEMLGNEKAGETFGQVVYTGLDVVSFLDGADSMLKSAGKLNTTLTDTAGTSFVWGKTSFDDVLNNEYKLYKPLDLLKSQFMNPSSTANFAVDSAYKTYSLYKKGVKLGDGFADIASSAGAIYSN